MCVHISKLGSSYCEHMFDTKSNIIIRLLTSNLNNNIGHFPGNDQKVTKGQVKGWPYK